MSEEKVLEKRARGYIKVNTEIDDGTVFDIQSDQIEEYCNNEGFELIEIHNLYDADNRSEMIKLLDNIQKGEYVIITDIFILTTLEFANMIYTIEEKESYFMCLSHDIDIDDPEITSKITCYLSIKDVERDSLTWGFFDCLSRVLEQLEKSSYSHYITTYKKI